MTAADLLREVHREGIQLEATDNGNIRIRGDGNAIAKWTSAIKQHKPELLDALSAWATLESAIHACCDARDDSDEHRAALLADCRQELPSDWDWFVAYFRAESGRANC